MQSKRVMLPCTLHVGGQEFKKSRVELVQFLAELPIDFVNRKRTYWRLAYQFIQPDLHTLEHVDQIKKAVEAARKK